ncbi:MAG: hypothetical protein V1814_03035 [Candidatus Moraniibacteriota bacterium]
MSFFEKQKTILSSYKKLFASPKPNKRWVVFFVLLAFLFLGSFLALSNKSRAAFTMTPEQRATFTTNYQNQRISVGLTAYTDQQMNGMINTYQNQYSSFDEALGALNDDSAGEALTNSADVGGQVNVEGESIFVKMALAAVIAVLSIIVFFLKFLVSWAGGLLDLVLRPELYQFVNNDMIKQGWVVVRDVCNLFFLLALLFIAICTILKIEKYHAKKTLLMLIIMALLINFSKPIAIFIFDGSQLLMNFFLSQINANQQSATTMYTSASQIADSVYKNIPSYFKGRMESSELALVYLFSTVFLFMLALAYIVIALFLIIRIVAVMLLIIVSPLAFFATVIPDFNKISSGWWDALFKYCYFGPAAAFFLLLATKLQGSLPNLGNMNIGGDQGTSMIVSNMVHYLTVIVFLYASVIMANKFGIYAAAGIIGNANKFMKWAGGMTKTGGVWGWGSRRSGVTGGVSQALQQSKWLRSLTKAGRQKGQAEREAAIASGLGVREAKFKNLQKQSKEKYKDADSSSVIADADAGKIEAVLEAAERGDMDDLKRLFNPKVLGAIAETPGLRDHLRHLYRKNNQTQFAATLQTLIPDQNRTGFSEMENAEHYANKELNRIDTSKIASVDWEDFAANEGHVPAQFLPVYKEALRKRLESLAGVNPSNFVDVVSNSKGRNINFIMDNKNKTDFGKIIEDAKKAAQQQSSGAGAGAATSTPPPNAPWS